MKYSEILKASKELLIDESRWLKSGSYFNYHRIKWNAPLSDDICMCGMGAAMFANRNEFACDISSDDVEFPNEFVKFITWINHKIVELTNDYKTFFEFNDSESTTHADLMSMFDSLIKIAEAEGI